MAQHGYYGTTRGRPLVDPNEETPSLDYWSQPAIGNMPLSRMVNLFGSLASAIAPQSVGGRMGRALSGMADPYEQASLQRESLLDFARREARARAQAETERGQRFSKVLGGLQPQRGGFRLGELQQPIPEGRVGMSLYGMEQPDIFPPISEQNLADIYQFAPNEHAAKAIEGIFRNQGRLPSEASAATERTLNLARDPRLRGLVAPEAQWSFKGGKEGLSFETAQPTPAKPEYTTEYIFDPERQGYVLAERQKGSPTLGFTRRLTPREEQMQVEPERKFLTPSEGAGVYEVPTAQTPGGFVVPPTPRPTDAERGVTVGKTYLPPSYLKTLTKPYREPETPTGQGESIKPTVAELRKQAEEEQRIVQLERARSFYSPELVGPVAGRLLQQRFKYGRDLMGTPLSQADANFMSLTKAIGNAVIQSISGAAVGEKQEVDRLMGQIPSELDPPAAWEAKYQQSLINIKELNARAKEKLRTSSSGPRRAMSPQEEADAYLEGR